jgi:hypothetical protein
MSSIDRGSEAEQGGILQQRKSPVGRRATRWCAITRHPDIAFARPHTKNVRQLKSPSAIGSSSNRHWITVKLQSTRPMIQIKLR